MTGGDPAGQGRGSSEDALPERAGIMQFAGLGLMNAICLAAGLTGGWFADQALGTLPLFLFLGLIAGIALGVLATRSEVRRFF